MDRGLYMEANMWRQELRPRLIGFVFELVEATFKLNAKLMSGMVSSLSFLNPLFFG